MGKRKRQKVRKSLKLFMLNFSLSGKNMKVSNILFQMKNNKLIIRIIMKEYSSKVL